MKEPEQEPIRREGCVVIGALCKGFVLTPAVAQELSKEFQSVGRILTVQETSECARRAFERN